VRFLLIRRNFIAEFKRHVKEGSGNVQLSPSGPPMGNLEGVHLLGLLRGRWRALEMEHLVLNNLGSFSLDPDYVRNLSLGQSGTSLKDQGFYDLASEYGAQRACFQAWVHRDQKGSNPVITLL
jgi:hypothetical protein